jgi:nicotinate-nucleotide pyrophosphorylase (carboxylating)
VEVEVEDLEQLQEALAAGAPVIMLDNMPVPLMRRAVAMVAGRAVVEASGGITLDTVRAVAETGVDLISIGGLTHSVKALDISLDLEFG